MTDNVAVLQGYTDEYIAECTLFDRHILLKPGTDLSSIFNAWDCDEQEFITVNGWNWTFIPI